MPGLTGGDWKRAANAEPRQSPTLPLGIVSWAKGPGVVDAALLQDGPV